MGIGRGLHSRRVWRGIGLAASIILIVTLTWWIVGRFTLDDRRIRVHRSEESITSPSDPVTTFRILAWNIAHGRGDAPPGVFRNWAGGTRETRFVRLARIAEVIRDLDPDIVVLNEVDFDSHWSGGLNQAEALARTLGYRVWVEQRNYDLRLPFGTLSFGNAVLSRFPVEEAGWIHIPPHSGLEAVAIGAKGASSVRLETSGGPLVVVPIHLEVRSEVTRIGAVPALDSLRIREAAPVVLAGDFNSSPPGWPGAEPETALGALLAAGWRSPRAQEPPGPSQWTYPSWMPTRAIDWVLVEPPLRVLEAEVIEGTRELSDHAPVLSVVSFGDAARRPATDSTP